MHCLYLRRRQGKKLAQNGNVKGNMRCWVLTANECRSRAVASRSRISDCGETPSSCFRILFRRSNLKSRYSCWWLVAKACANTKGCKYCHFGIFGNLPCSTPYASDALAICCAAVHLTRSSRNSICRSWRQSWDSS